MHTTNLRKVGGSIMLAVPPVFLDQIQLQAGAVVGLAVDQGRLGVEPKPRPRYTLAELLSNSDYSQATNEDEQKEQQAWVDGPAVGGELI